VCTDKKVESTPKSKLDNNCYYIFSNFSSNYCLDIRDSNKAEGEILINSVCN
jgi:hypothetical protein